MKICKNCGVELDENMEVCPLCGENEDEGATKNTGSVIYPSDALDVAKKESRKHAWELSGVVTFSGILISVFIDFVFGKGLQWSLYSISALLFVWSAITFFFFALQKPLILYPGLLIITMSIQVLFDLIDKPVKWFIPIGLPVTLTFFLLVGTVVIIYRYVKHKGFNILAVILIALCIFCMASEIFIDLAVFNTIVIKWSAIVTSALLPVAMVLLFMHYRLERGRRLDSFFHV